MKTASQGSVFEYSDYKQFIREWIQEREGGGRGTRSQFAKVLRCHVAYVSRILSGDAHFSLEQAYALCEFLGLNTQEADFFLLLVLYGRAGTRELQNHYSAKIKMEIEKRNLLKNRLEHQKNLSEIDRATYYSSWHYTAVHLLVTMPAYQTKDALVRYLRISVKRLNEILQFLLKEGLILENKGRYQSGPMSIHLGNDSSQISKHHTNWRLQAIQSLDREKPEELHYSSVVTVGKNDVPEIRKIMVSTIEKIRAVVKASAEDSLYSYAFDLFQVGQE